MSMNKMFKKVLAVVAAGAMTMGMAMPTFAADEGKTTEAWITKTYRSERLKHLALQQHRKQVMV